MLYLFLPAHAAPPTIHVVYTVRFDLDETGDRLCPITKLCDCTATYEGSGVLVEEEDDRLTFRGSWRRRSDSCAEPLQIWSAGEATAWHTLRHREGTLTEWVVHGDPGQHRKRQQQIRANQQFWMDALGAAWPAREVRVVQRDGTTLVGGIRLEALHQLEINNGP